MGKLYLRFIAGAILAATACAQPLQASELTVNDGTVVNDKAPFWFYNLDNSAFRSQTIYPAAACRHERQRDNTDTVLSGR